MNRMFRSLGRVKGWWLAGLAALCLIPGTPGAQAQVAAPAIAMAGSYQNFDVLNNTGGPTYGFEMEVYGVSKSQLTRIFPSNFNAGVIRYGFGTATDFPGGVRVRWAATYDPASGTYSTFTPAPPSLTTVPGDSCWTLGMPATYQTAGCEHFGISSVANPTTINYRWLVPDPANPGALIPNTTYVNLPAPVWTAVPPANPALPPVVVAVVQAPPPPAPAVFGDAEWVKVYKTEQQGKVDLDQLVGDNHAVVPEAAAQLEVSWSLLQQDPPDGGKKKQRGKLANQGNLGNGNHAVVRRYEYYKYAGAYDPITHEALCADLTCTAPSPGELGDAIGAQNAAANLNVNALSVTVNGGGDVSSSDKVFSCPNKCYGVYNPGSTVTLTAKANSGNAFSGWSGACSGNASTCTVAMNAESAVTATFVSVAGGGGGAGGTTFTLSVGLTNPGTVTSSPAGISCPSPSCSAKFAAGTTVVLTATPPAGKSFVGWSGACSGNAISCSVALNADSKVQASFSK
jgi:List-Bact-rpt repeat protein